MSLVLVLVKLIAGRIIPAVTRNWLAARSAAALLPAFSALREVDSERRASGAT